LIINGNKKLFVPVYLDNRNYPFTDFRFQEAAQNVFKGGFSSVDDNQRLRLLFVQIESYSINNERPGGENSVESEKWRYSTV
jgi:hypothetical protein